MRLPTLKTIRLDMILTVGKFLKPLYMSVIGFSVDNISAITLAAVLKDKEMLQHLIERHPDKDKISPAVALAGNLDVHKWTIKRMKCPMNEWACTAAAQRGDIEMLKYLHENGCPWDKNICKTAVRGRHLDVLKFLSENGCPWDESTCSAAASYGHLDILKYLH
jgi:hypothetical protein